MKKIVAILVLCPLALFAEYKHAEYIRLVPSNDTTPTYVATGLGPTTSTMEFKFKFQMEGHVNWGGCFKDYIDEAHDTTRIIYDNTSTTDYRVYFMSQAGGGGTIFKNVTTGVNQIIEGYLRKTSARLNDVQMSFTKSAGTANNQEIKLMCTCSSSKATASRIYKFQVYDTTSNKLVKEFVPVYDPANPSDCGFWDGKTVRKAAAGTLEAGPAGSGMTIEVKPHYVFDGVHPIDEPIVRDAVTGAVLVKGEDYDYVITGPNAVGTATVTVTNKKTSTVETATFEVTGLKNAIYATPNPTYDPTTGAEVATPTTFAGFAVVEAWSLTNALSKITAGTTVVLMKGTYVVPESKRGVVNLYSLTANNVTIRSETGDPTDVVVQGLGDGSNLRFVYVNATGARLHGLTIEKFARTVSGGGTGSGSGGAIYCENQKSLTVTNCVFRENFAGTPGSAEAGGGAIGGSGTVTVYDTFFTNNLAFGRGAAINGSNAKAYRCRFVSNVCTNHGTHAQGAAVFQGAYYDCEFIRNRAVATGGSAQSWGGAMYLPAAVSNCLFVANVAETRGQSIASRTVTIRDCTFTGHKSGAAILNVDNGGFTTTLSRCVLTNNASQLSAAGVVMWNSLIAKNNRVSGSGARGIVDTRLYNCTVVDNAMSDCGNWNSVFLDRSVCINSVIVNDDVKYAMVGDSTYWVVMTNCVWSGVASKAGGAPTGKDIVKVEKLADLKLSCADPTRPYDITRRSKVLLDKGTTAGLGYTAASLDLAKRPRVVTKGKTLAADPDALPDIGCYEFQEGPRGLTIVFW